VQEDAKKQNEKLEQPSSPRCKFRTCIRTTGPDFCKTINDAGLVSAVLTRSLGCRALACQHQSNTETAHFIDFFLVKCYFLFFFFALTKICI